MAKSGKSHLVFHKTCLPIVTMNDYRHFATGPYSRGAISTERFWQISAGPHLSSLGRIFRCDHYVGTQ